MGRKPTVIAVNAVSGGGKTTITRELTGRLENAKALYFDDYENIGRNIPDITDWIENGADYSLWDLQELADDITKLLEEQPDYIILDYPFGYRQKQIAGFIHFSVYIDTPLDIALARRIIRDYSAQGNIDAILEELDSYLHVRNSYRYSQAMSEEADLIVNGSLETCDIIDIIIEKILDY